jgi:hypothetical protein
MDAGRARSQAFLSSGLHVFRRPFPAVTRFAARPGRPA